MLKRPVILLLLFFSSMSLFAQMGEDKDSLVRLLSAEKARLVEIDGKEYRKVIGNAVFLHNNTYLLCDSAYWNVDDNYIDAVGNIKIRQENTVLSGDSLRYVIDENLACLRGKIVQLIDKDSNVLRTENLDYNTRDSIAVFFDGASMRDKDGNIIESDRGSYDSPRTLFTFIKNVQMFSDSIFFISDTLKYNSQTDIADFGGRIDAWYEENNINAEKGRYDRAKETFDFERSVHILTEDYEIRCEKLFYDRYRKYAHLQNKIEILDTIDNSVVMGDDLYYWDSPRRVEITKNPVIMVLQESEEGTDSLFMKSDTLIYYQQKMFEIDSALIAQAKERHEATLVDPVAQIRKQSGGGAERGENKGAAKMGSDRQAGLQGNKNGGGMRNLNAPASEGKKSGGDRQAGLQGNKNGGGMRNLNAPASEGKKSGGDRQTGLQGNKKGGGIQNLNAPASEGKKSGGDKSGGAKSDLSSDSRAKSAGIRKGENDTLSSNLPETVKDSLAVADSAAVSDTLMTAGSLTAKGSLAAADSVMAADSLTAADVHVPAASSLKINSLMTAGSLAAADSLTAKDSLAAADSLTAADSLGVSDTTAVAEPIDTTVISFVEAYHNVKIYKSDIQVLCDSLMFSALDSIARLFTDPVIWYQVKNQVTSDSMQFVLKNQELEKGYILSNAFVIAEEVPDKYYHQIKSPEMIGYFDEAVLSRFDALGGVNAIFYLQEDSVVTMMNQKDCRIFSVLLKNGSLQKTYNYESAKNDAYPVYKLTEEQQKLKNFKWRGDERFPDRFALTDAVIRPSLRNSLTPSSRFPKFIITNKYFPGYIDSIIFEIDNRKPLIWIKR